MELLTNRSPLEMAENLIRLGAPSMRSKRLATMNNKYREGFDETKKRTYIFFMDANNLCGGIMQKFPLPLSEFEIVDVALSTIFKTANDTENGFVFEVNLDNTDAFPKIHKDLPLDPTKVKIHLNMLTEYQMGLLD